MERDGYRCRMCGGASNTGSFEGLHVHHIIPKTNNGSHDMDNLITLCKRCHKTTKGIHKGIRHPTHKTMYDDGVPETMNCRVCDMIFKPTPGQIKEHHWICKSCEYERKKRYREQNKQRISEKKKAEYQQNKRQSLARSKSFYEKNREQQLSYQKEYYQQHRDARLEYHKEYYSRPEQKDKRAEYKREYRLKPEVKKRTREKGAEYRLNPKNNKKIQARGKINLEITTGRINREPCEVCGNPVSEAHHPDYNEPLNVVWLCRVHHIAVERGIIKVHSHVCQDISTNGLEGGVSDGDTAGVGGVIQ